MSEKITREKVNKCRKICGPQWMMLNCLSHHGCFDYKQTNCSQRSIAGQWPADQECLGEIRDRVDKCHKCLHERKVIASFSPRKPQP